MRLWGMGAGGMRGWRVAVSRLVSGNGCLVPAGGTPVIDAVPVNPVSLEMSALCHRRTAATVPFRLF